MDIAEYVKDKTGLSARALALKIGYNHTKLNRHLKGDATMETLRDIARATDLDFLELCKLTGFLTDREVRSLRGNASLQDVSDDVLAQEVLRRMQSGSEVLDTPIDEYQDGLALAAESDDQFDLDEGDMDA